MTQKIFKSFRFKIETLIYFGVFIFPNWFLYADKQGLSVSAGSRTTEVQILYERLRSGLVEPPGWFLQNGFPASNDLSGQYLNRNTEQVHFGGFGYSVSRERSEVHWNMLVAAKEILPSRKSIWEKTVISLVSYGGFSSVWVAKNIPFVLHLL